MKRLPILNADDEKGPYFWLARGNFTGRPRSPRAASLPGITDEQADALDAVHFAAIKHAVKLAPRKGDLYFVNNFAILHSRTAFVDGGKQRRHLLRLWLRDPRRGKIVSEPLVPRFKEVFDVEAAKRGRWLLTREMEPDVVSEKLFKKTFSVESINSCQNH